MKSQYVREEKQKKKKSKAQHSTAVKTQETQQGNSAGALPAGEPTEEVKEQQKEAGDNEAEVEHLREWLLADRKDRQRQRQTEQNKRTEQTEKGSTGQMENSFASGWPESKLFELNWIENVQKMQIKS